MGNTTLGEFEELVLLAVAVLKNEAYGVSVKKEIQKRLKRSVSVGALQSALRRMEKKDTSIHFLEKRPHSGAAKESAILKSPFMGRKRWPKPWIAGFISGKQHRNYQLNWTIYYDQEELDLPNH